MRWLLLTAFLVLGGCGRAELQIELETLSGDDPFAGVVELSIVVRQNGKVVDEVRQPFGSDGAVSMLPIDRDGDIAITLAGYDDSGLVTARGEASPELPGRSATCCVRVCFCTVTRFDAGDCTCGSKACRDC